MDERGKFNRPSPLRNSKAANRPFQSPLRSVLSPRGKLDSNEKPQKNLNLVDSSPCRKTLTTPEKRISRQPQLLTKRICLEREDAESERDETRSIDEVELKKIRDRISAKKQELEHVKQQLIYEKKHESRDLNNLIERWLRGCQEALMQFQKNISLRSGAAVSMTEILQQLGIPPDLVKYSVEDCDFV